VRNLQSQARRHALIAVAGCVPDGIIVRPLWELVLDLDPAERANTALGEGRFGGGMKAIGPELVALARDYGVPLVRSDFPGALEATLQNEQVRANAAAPVPRGSKYLAPLQLESVSLRHLWLGFETTAETFVYGFIDSHRDQLAALGCNEADVVHIKQGFEALRNIFSAVIVLTGTRRPLANECPFHPYNTRFLKNGVPIDQYLRFSPPGEALMEDDAIKRNTMLVRQLISVLVRFGEGGFASYLRQRELFKVDLFNGGGPGHCPFSQMATQTAHAAAVGFKRALSKGSIMLAPDRPPGA
jgi:hypothetical protein